MAWSPLWAAAVLGRAGSDSVRTFQLILCACRFYRSRLLVLRRKLVRPQLEIQLIDCSGEAERDVVGEAPRAAGLEPDVEGSRGRAVPAESLQVQYVVST